MHDIDDFNYYVVYERTDFLPENDYVSRPKDSSDESMDVVKTHNIWLDNMGWL